MAAAAEEAELVLHKEPGPRVRGGGGPGGLRSLRWAAAAAAGRDPAEAAGGGPFRGGGVGGSGRGHKGAEPSPRLGGFCLVTWSRAASEQSGEGAEVWPGPRRLGERGGRHCIARSNGASESRTSPSVRAAGARPQRRLCRQLFTSHPYRGAGTADPSPSPRCCRMLCR